MVCKEESSPLQSEMSTSTVVRGRADRMAPMVSANAPAPPSARSSRATQVTTAWARPIRATAWATRFRLFGIERERVAGVDLTKPTRSRAPGPVDHEGGGPVGPALVDVRAACLLAHGDQVEVAEVMAQFLIAGSHCHRHAQPWRLPLVATATPPPGPHRIALSGDRGRAPRRGHDPGSPERPRSRPVRMPSPRTDEAGPTRI